MSTPFITLRAHTSTWVTRPMTDDRFGPTVEVELTPEDLHDLAAAAFAHAEQLEDRGLQNYAEDMRYVRSIMTAEIDAIEEGED